MRERVDQAAARAAFVVARALGAKVAFEDLLPRWEQRAQTPEEMIAVMRGIQRRQRAG